MEYLTFAIIAILVGIIVFGGGYLLTKYPEIKKALANSKLILQIIDKINEMYDWKWSGALDDICDYTLMAINIVEETQTEKDLTKLREIIFRKALDICILNGVNVDEDLLDILGKIVDEAILMKKEG